MDNSEFRIEALAPTHVVGAFSCGDPDIDEYLHTRALAEQRHGLNRVYVLIDRQEFVCGYFTLSPLSIPIDQPMLSKLGLSEVPYRSIGGYLLGRLGVRTELQRQGIGEALVARAGQIAARQQVTVGGVFLAVDPKTDKLVSWYEKLGFVRLSPNRRRLVLPLRTLG